MHFYANRVYHVVSLATCKCLQESIESFPVHFTWSCCLSEIDRIKERGQANARN